MNVNPYAAPQPPHQLPPQGPYYGTGGGPQPWEVGEVLSKAWTVFTQNWAVLVFPLLIVQIIEGIPGNAATVLVQADVIDQQSSQYQLVSMGGSAINILLQGFFTTGATRLMLKALRGQQPAFSDIFSGGDRYFSMLGAVFLTALAVGFGTLACIVPGIILWLGLLFAPYLVVDRRMGAIEALSESWRMTKGQKGSLFIMGLASIAVFLVGVLACGIGIFVAAPIVGLAWAIIYQRIAGIDGAQQGMQPMQYAAPMPGANPYGPPPGGGYGGGYGPPPPGGYGA